MPRRKRSGLREQLEQAVAELFEDVVPVPTRSCEVPSVTQPYKIRLSVALREERRQAFKARRGRCFYCGRNVSKKHFTRDHVCPKVQGGRQVIPCCKRCNKLKSKLSPEEFRPLLAAEMGMDPATFRFYFEEVLERDQGNGICV